MNLNIENKICELYLNEYTIKDLSNQFNCSTPTIRKVLIKNNIERVKNPTRRVCEKIKTEICKEYLESQSTILFLSTKYKYHVSTISKILKENNIFIKRKHKKPKRYFNELEIKEILDLYKGGKNITFISKRFKAGNQTIKHLIQENYTIYDPYNLWTENDVNNLIELRNSGLSRFRISKILNKSINQIKSKIAKLKLAKLPTETLKIKKLSRESYINDFDKYLRLRYYNIKSKSIRMEKDFNITLEEFFIQWDKQNGKCFYTGQDLDYLPNKENSFSVDRIDSKMGYISGNIVFCLIWVNSMKLDRSVEEFLQMCKFIVDHSLNLKKS